MVVLNDRFYPTVRPKNLAELVQLLIILDVAHPAKSFRRQKARRASETVNLAAKIRSAIELTLNARFLVCYCFGNSS